MDLRLLLNPSSQPQAHNHPLPLPHTQLKLLPTSPVSRPTTPTVTLPSPVLPSPHAPGSKRRELRAVGQAHRDRQRDEQDALRQCVAGLQEDNHRMKLCIAVLRGGVVHDVDALRAMLEGEVAPGPAFHRTSNVLAARLGVRYLTGAMAVLLLEFIAARRNVAHCERRPRGCELLCPAPSVFNTILARGTAQIHAEAARLAAIHNIDSSRWVTHVLHSMATIHSKWCDLEQQSCLSIAQVNLISSRDDALCNKMQIAKARRPKKCHKCGQERSAGSGHPRGFCNAHRTSPLSLSKHPDDDDSMSIV